MTRRPPGGSALAGLLLRKIPISASQAKIVACHAEAGDWSEESAGWVKPLITRIVKEISRMQLTMLRCKLTMLQALQATKCFKIRQGCGRFETQIFNEGD